MKVDTANIAKIMQKLKAKDYSLFIALQKKIAQIGALDMIAVEHLKNLRHDSSYLKRVQIGCFVLVFRVKEDTIVFEDFDHHDRIYKKLIRR